MTTIRIRRKRDGSFVEALAGGATRPSVDRTDWARLDTMTDEEITAAALADPDNPPLTDDDLRRMKPAPRAKVIRRALNLTQEAFAARYHIPLGTLRDWEQGRAEPDQPTRAYLRAIAGDPHGVQRALEAAPG
jgi:putative transcriptional regulator